MLKKIVSFFREDKYKKLLEKIESLEGRVFEKKKKESSLWGFSAWTMWDSFYEPETLEKEIDILQDKVDAIAEYLRVDLRKTADTEGEWIAKKIKK